MRYVRLPNNKPIGLPNRRQSRQANCGDGPIRLHTVWNCFANPRRELPTGRGSLFQVAHRRFRLDISCDHPTVKCRMDSAVGLSFTFTTFTMTVVPFVAATRTV